VKEWRDNLGAKGFRYFVLKAADIFEALTPKQLQKFDDMLGIIEKHRQSESKPPSLKYWVFARHWPGSHAVKTAMETALGHSIGEPYDFRQNSGKRRK